MPPPAALDLPNDKSLAPIRHDGDVTVRGPVAEGRPVQVAGSLTVAGAIEAVELSAGGAVTVDGGIIGKQKGRYTVGGDLRCRFISGATVVARRDIHVHSEIVHSRVTCTGRLELAAGALYGGDVAANGGVACHTLGHASGVATLVEAGAGRALRLLVESMTPQIEANRKRVATVRAGVEPLLAKMKSLSPQQREKATELLYEAGELEAATATMVAAFEQRKRLILEHARPDIAVAGLAHAGVVVRIDGVEAALSSPIKGPLTLTRRKTDGRTEIILVDAADGSTCVLPSRQDEAAAA